MFEAPSDTTIHAGPGRSLATADVRRVLLVHNRYQIRGGEDAAVEREAAALARAGIAVDVVLFDNDVIATPLDRLRTAVAAPCNRTGIGRVIEAVRRARPDVVHCHNTFPLVSPAVHAAVRRLGVATVQTLHNFRITCANGSLFRDGTPCELCIAGSPYQAVPFGCYRGSRLGSVAVARMIATHRRRGTWTRDVDRFIALSAFARDKFIAAGLPGDRIRVKANGLPDPGFDADTPRAGLLYVGRLGAEKGVGVLADAARLMTTPVTVIGDGPLRAEIADCPGLDLRGSLDSAAVAAAMAGAAAIIVPSLCYENMPMVVAEAFAAGTPVIASHIGSLPGLIEEGVTGLLVPPNDPAALAAAAERLAGDPAAARRMGAAARNTFLRLWSEETTTAALRGIYAEALQSRAAAVGV